MTSVKQKKCGNPECTNTFPQFNSLQKYCSASCKSTGKKKKNYIKPISDKRAERLAEYRVKRDKYLKDNPVCEVEDCSNESNNLHHKNGRTNERLTDTKYFMACCGSCHPKRIHENPKWAREKGYLI